MPEEPADEAAVRLGPELAEIGQAARRPEPLDHRRRAHPLADPILFRKPLEHGQVHRLGRGAQHLAVRPGLQAGDQRLDAGEVRLAFAPVELLQRRHPVPLDRKHLFRREGIGAFLVQRAERAILLVPPGTPGDLRHLGHGQPALAAPVELGKRGEGDMVHVHVEAHADRIGGNEIIDLARLEHRHLGIAGAGAERPHHHCRTAAEPAKRLGDGIDFLGAERDDRRAARQTGELLRPGIAEGREARPADHLGLGHQRLQHGFQAVGAEDHRLLAAAGTQQPIGEDMAALGIGAQLRLVQADERDFAFQRHALGGAQEPAGLGRQDLLFAGDQRDLGIAALHPDDAIIDLARQQPQREADHAAGMAGHPLHCEMRLAGVGRTQHGGDRRTRETTHCDSQDRSESPLKQLPRIGDPP